MLNELVLPTKSLDNWEQVRDEWISAVEQLVKDAETWAQKQSWAVRRDMKSVTEDRLGTYTVPRLLIHTMDGRLLLDPIAGTTHGARGVVDFYALPSYDFIIIPRIESGWHFVSDRFTNLEPWTEKNFIKTAKKLLEENASLLTPPHFCEIARERTRKCCARPNPRHDAL